MARPEPVTSIAHLLILLWLAGCTAPPPLTALAPGDTLASGCVGVLRAELQVWGTHDRVLIPIARQSDAASARAVDRLSAHWPDRRLAVIPASAVLREHLALYDLVAGESLRRKSQSPGLTVGPGLGGVVDCPYAVVLQGAQFPAGALRKPLLSLGLVEVRSGRLLWLNALGDARFDTPDRLDHSLDRLMSGAPP